MDFSIVIPAKNEEANIVRCLDSLNVLEWDKQEYEVIVVDNGSSDRTVELARERGASVYVKPELTISGLRNFGASKAAGQVLAFLDADCAVVPRWLSAASEYLDETKGVVAFGSPVVLPETYTWVQRAWFNVRGKPGQVVEVEWLESANLFVRRSSFNAVGGFNESLVTCEDYDLTQKLKNVGRLVSDYRVAAIHYREPSTVREFFKKEMWRGKSNFSRLLTAKINKAEIPSLALPVIYILLLAGVTTSGAVYIFDRRMIFLLYFWVLLLSWQGAIFMVSCLKNKSSEFIASLQLFILFNAYFLARGLAMLRRS